MTTKTHLWPLPEPISTAKQRGKILGFCKHDADPYVEDARTGRLTTYAAHAEAVSHVEDGWHVLEWGGEYAEVGEYGEVLGRTPAWWFLTGRDEWDVVANPTHWLPLPPDAVA